MSEMKLSLNEVRAMNKIAGTQMTKEQEIRLIKERLQQLNEGPRPGAGRYISNDYMEAIINSLKDSKLLNQSVINRLKKKRDYRELEDEKHEISDIIVKNSDKVIKSLEKYGEKYLNDMAVKDLIDAIKDVKSGRWDYIALPDDYHKGNKKKRNSDNGELYFNMGGSLG